MFTEQAGERGAPPRDAGAYRARRNLQHRRDLGVVQVTEITQDDRRSVVLGELSEGGVYRQPIGDLAVGRVVRSPNSWWSCCGQAAECVVVTARRGPPGSAT